MSSQISARGVAAKVGTGVAVARAGRGRKALDLPSSPSQAFENLSRPFSSRRGLDQSVLRPDQSPMISELTRVDLSFGNTDFGRNTRKGKNLQNIFNVKVKRTFGPQNLPKRRKRFTF